MAKNDKKNKDAAQEDQDAAQEESPSKDAVTPPAEAPAKPVSPKVGVGDIVLFHKATNTGYHTEVTACAAMVIGFPPATDNYQAKDFAVKLKVFQHHGDEIKTAMFAQPGQPKANRWTLKD